MPTELLPSLLLLVVGVGFSPGPATIFSMTCAIRYGRRQALRMWLGLLVGFTLGALAMAYATFLLGEAMGQYVKYIKYFGALYMAYLAFTVYRSSDKSNTGRHSCTFFSGLMVQLTNAKLLLFDIMVYSAYVLPYHPDSFPPMLPVAGILEIAGPGADLVWLLLGSALHHYYSRHRRAIDTAMAVCLLICAVAIALS